VPNETPNDTRTPREGPRQDWRLAEAQSDAESSGVTVEGKRQEIYLALKFFAVRSVQKDDLETARQCLNAAQIVYEIDPVDNDDAWEGL
jgi:hypothetical protein